MRGATRWRPGVRLSLVLTLSALVYAAPAEPSAAQTTAPPAKTKRAPSASKAKPTGDSLPRAVLDMLEQIQAAVHSGYIEDLADAVDWNELKPDLGQGFGPDSVSDPVGYWKSISKDGHGRDILDVLGRLLAGKPAVRPLGRDLENNRLYTWPSFADIPLSKMSPAELDTLAALVPAELLGPKRDKDRYTGWRLTLGADGTWHSFRRE